MLPAKIGTTVVPRVSHSGLKREEGFDVRIFYLKGPFISVQSIVVGGVFPTSDRLFFFSSSGCDWMYTVVYNIRWRLIDR